MPPTSPSTQRLRQLGRFGGCHVMPNLAVSDHLMRGKSLHAGEPFDNETIRR
jgi:hypothetical protein